MTHILIPRTPSMNLLRPFIECPTPELDQAWAAMVRIAEVQHARAGSQCLAQIEEPAGAAPAAASGPSAGVEVMCERLKAIAASDSKTAMRNALMNAARYIAGSAQTAPALEAPAALPVPADEFRGDTPSLVRNIVALLELDADGALVPHGVGGHARGLLSAAAARLAAAPQAPAEAQEPAANLHDDGYWTPTKTEAGRALNERLMRAGSPRIPVYTHPAPQQAAPQAPAAPAEPVELDIDRVLALADLHADDSREDGVRLLDRGGLVALAQDVLRIFAPEAAPAAPAVDASDVELLDFLQQTATAVEVLAQDEGEPPRFLVNRAISKDVRCAIRLARGKAIAAQAKEGGAA